MRTLNRDKNFLASHSVRPDWQMKDEGSPGMPQSADQRTNASAIACQGRYVPKRSGRFSQGYLGKVLGMLASGLCG